MNDAQDSRLGARQQGSKYPASARQTRTPSGAKYRTRTGGHAIRNGIKATAVRPLPAQSRGQFPDPGKPAQRQAKPPWLRVKVAVGEGISRIRGLLREENLYTVCEESHCPNLAECWTHGTATIMLLGDVCTRACRFCAVDTGNPMGWTDPDEPDKVARTVRVMNLGYLVLTSVDRDDLPDGGAGHYAACVRRVREHCPEVKVETLAPDFSGNVAALQMLLESGLHVFAQNLETVRRLTHRVRDPRAGYEQTLDVLAAAKRMRPEVLTKSSLMLGLGESESEVLTAMQDLRAHQVDILTLGQYLQPTEFHLPVEDWVPPEAFEEYRQAGLSMGFLEVASGPLVRSSYRADRVFDGNNLGLAHSAQDHRSVREHPDRIRVAQIA